MNNFDVTSNITLCHKDEFNDDCWVWTVYLNGTQYASEILPETSREVAWEAVKKWTERAFQETSPFYFPQSTAIKRERK